MEWQAYEREHAQTLRRLGADVSYDSSAKRMTIDPRKVDTCTVPYKLTQRMRACQNQSRCFLTSHSQSHFNPVCPRIMRSVLWRRSPHRQGKICPLLWRLRKGS